MNPDEYDDWLMEQAARRADRRRRLMAGALVVAMAALIFIPVVRAFA